MSNKGKKLKLNCGDSEAFKRWSSAPYKTCCYWDANKETGEFTGVIIASNKQNIPHRQYPTIQLYKDPGAFKAVRVELDVFVADFELNEPAHWITLGSLTTDTTDRWGSCVSINLARDLDGKPKLCLHHAPFLYAEEYEFRNKKINFPMDQWVHLTIECDMLEYRRIKVYQDKELILQAQVLHSIGPIAQLRFGLHAHPLLSSGMVRNRALTIKEINIDAE